MFWFKERKMKEELSVPINGEEIRVFIYHENRKNCRVSIGKKGIHIRLANFLNKEQKIQQTRKFLQWAEKEILVKRLDANLPKLRYSGKSTLQLFDRELELFIEETDDHKAKAVLNENILKIILPNFLSQTEKETTCAAFITKILRKIYQKKIEDKLHEFNEKWQFGTINKVRLKNNSSNWGSCSSKGNINISVRLFLAPESEVNYVLIHELAHLKEANHGNGFWQLVAQACPNYQQSEVWLKVNGHLCRI